MTKSQHMNKGKNLSVIIPVFNEDQNISSVLTKLVNKYPDAEIIVVNDASIDDTAEVCKQFPIILISHPYRIGNGAAIKTGLRKSTRDIIVCMDGDGQHKVEDISRFLEKLDEGFDMIVGARYKRTQASLLRYLANTLYNKLASWMVGHTISDLTSGFRVAYRKKFLQFYHLLPNGFSYPTTITMAFFRSGYYVDYVPIEAMKRKGSSSIRILRDGFRFLVIIFRIGTLYSPLKLFIPISAMHFALALSYYGYTYITEHRFTNMSVLLFTVSLVIGLIGLISEQITNLNYSRLLNIESNKDT